MTDARSRALRWGIWLPGLAVAVGAAVATAHGIYEVAHAARVPAGIAWLYPLLTDGLALVAYAATARLTGSAARYAWAVVVLAAGLSGLAQAAFLASGSAVDASPLLRFGVGAWPAIAAAIVAHLLYLLATDSPPIEEPSDVERLYNPGDVQPLNGAPVAGPGVQRPTAVQSAVDRSALTPRPVEQRAGRPGPSPARDRASAAATRHAQRHGALPTVTDLAALAEVSRGTAAAVLRALRAQPTPLHLIHTTQPDSPDARTQP